MQFIIIINLIHLFLKINYKDFDFVMIIKFYALFLKKKVQKVLFYYDK